MAFGNRSSQSGTQFGPNTKVFYVSIKEKNLEQPYFEIKQKEGDKYVTIHSVADKIKYLGGNLVDLRNKVFQHEGKDIESVSATFVDAEKDEAYLLTISHGYLGRNILNSLLSLKTFNGIEIGLYVTKPKPGHEKGFNSAAVRQNQALIYGKFKNEELPKITKVKVGKDVHSDTTEITAFFTAQVEEFSKTVREANPAGGATKGNSVGAVNEEAGDGVPADLFEPNDGEVTLPGGKPLPF
jgi:hypothetical protein